MTDQSKREDPQFETNSVDDLEELLARAANFADCYCSDTIASEFRDAREFVANDLRDELEDDPVLVTDGGQSETGLQHSPDYDVEIEADELLAKLAADAADYGEDYEEKRSWWAESLETLSEFHDARYWMQEARGGQRAYSEALAALQPGGRFRNADGTVDIRGYLRWLSQLADDANDRSYGPYTKTREADEAETAYVSVMSTIRNEFGVGWQRLDDIGGNPIQEDLP